MNILLALVLAATTPCVTEDSTNCYWDAQSMGNGVGNSFIALEYGADLVLLYP